MPKKFSLTTSLICCALGAALFWSGCATPPRPLPATYIQEEHEMSIEITKISEEGQFRDTGNGGLIGAIVNSGRQSTLREKMQGIKGETVASLLRQQMTRNLEEFFYIEDSTDDLRVEVEVVTWGWFLPTAMLGIKAGDYQFEVIGTVRVFDQSLPEKEQMVGYTMLRASKPLGNDPDESALQEAMLKCTDDFAKLSVDYLLSQSRSSGGSVAKL